MKQNRRVANPIVRGLLGIHALRRRLIFALIHDHFPELELRLPLGENLFAPLDHLEAMQAFSETFLGGEYGNLWERIPLPARWLDLGSHRGYFSLWTAWERARRGATGAVEALLIDADPRAQTWFRRLWDINPALSGFKFLGAAVASPEGGDTVQFAQRPGMSSIIPGAMPVDCDHLVSVPRLKTAAVAALLPGPYDLIKIDIEGSEFALFETMGDLLTQARHVVVEWHGHGEGAAAAEARLHRAATALGFRPPEVLRETRSVPTSVGAFVSGTVLYSRPA